MYRFEWRFIVLRVHTNTLQTFTADGLTSQVCLISLPAECYMWKVSLYVKGKHTGYADFPTQAPIYLYTTMAFMRRSIAEIMRNM